MMPKTQKIPIEDFKKLLPKDANLTDEQAMKLKGQMEGLAHLMFDMWQDGRLKKIIDKEQIGEEKEVR